MKKIIALLICLININYVSANEIKNIENETQIKYKWYKEEIVDGIYHPKKEQLEGYLEDSSNVRYGNPTIWSEKYCGYPRNHYSIETKQKYVYERVQESKYIKLENININDIKGITIYYKNEIIDYEITKNEENLIEMELGKSYEVDYLWFYIDADKEYDIVLSNYENYTLQSISKHIKDMKVLIPDETWITSKTTYVQYHTDNSLEETDFIKSKKTVVLCRASEIKTYRYKTNKVYYDDNYHNYIENFIPDLDDYIIEYTGELPKETITITKTEIIKDKEIQKEYIYQEDSQNIRDEQCEQTNETSKQQEPVIETKYIETEVIKKIYKVPKKIYICIILLILVIIIQFVIKIIKKRVEKNI